MWNRNESQWHQEFQLVSVTPETGCFSLKLECAAGLSSDWLSFTASVSLLVLLFTGECGSKKRFLLYNHLKMDKTRGLMFLFICVGLGCHMTHAVHMEKLANIKICADKDCSCEFALFMTLIWRSSVFIIQYFEFKINYQLVVNYNHCWVKPFLCFWFEAHILFWQVS